MEFGSPNNCRGSSANSSNTYFSETSELTTSQRSYARWLAVAFVGLAVFMGMCVGLGSAVGTYPDVDDDMVLYYHFNNQSEYGEDDTQVYDFSGKGNNGTIIGGATYTNSSILNDTVIKLSSMTQYVNVTGSASGILNQSYPQLTVAAWIRPDSLVAFSSASARFITKNGHYIFYFNNNTGALSFDTVGLSDNSISGGVNVVVNSWQFVVFTYNGTTKSLFYNGLLVSSEAATGNITASSANPLTIGGRFGQFTMNGSIDEVIIYNRSLLDSEVWSVYQSYVSCISPNAPITFSFSTNLCPGVYAINGTTTGAITLGASNIILDCNGAYLYGNTSTATQMRGIYGASISNVTIRNCRLEEYERAINIRLASQIVLQNITTNNSEYSINLESVNNVIINDSSFFSSVRYPLYFYAGSNGTVLNSLFSNKFDASLDGVYVENANLTIQNSRYINYGGHIVNSKSSEVMMTNVTMSNINGSVYGNSSTFRIYNSTFSNFVSEQLAVAGISGFENVYLVGSTNNIIQGNIFNYTLNEEAIYFNSSSGIIDSNTFYDTNRHSIAVRNSQWVNITNNYIRNAGWKPLLGGYAIDVFGRGGNVLLRDNIVEESYDCVIFSMEDGWNMTSINNTCRNTIDYGVYFRGVNDALSMNDVVSNATERALSSIGDLVRSTNVRFVNTTIVNQSDYSFVITKSDNVTFENITLLQDLYNGRIDVFSTNVRFVRVGGYTFRFVNASNLAFNITSQYLRWFNANVENSTHAVIEQSKDGLVVYSNGSLPCGNSLVTGDCNITLQPGNYSYVLDDYNKTEGTTREYDPLGWSVLKESIKSINSSLSDTLYNVTVVVYTNGTKPENPRYVPHSGTSVMTLAAADYSYNSTAGTFEFIASAIEPSAASNTLYLDGQSPRITVSSPTYAAAITASQMLFQASATDENLDSLWYELVGEGTGAVQFDGYESVSLSAGTHTVKFCANDSSNNIACSSDVTFNLLTGFTTTGGGGSSGGTSSSTTTNNSTATESGGTVGLGWVNASVTTMDWMYGVAYPVTIRVFGTDGKPLDTPLITAEVISNTSYTVGKLVRLGTGVYEQAFTITETGNGKAIINVVVVQDGTVVNDMFAVDLREASGSEKFVQTVKNKSGSLITRAYLFVQANFMPVVVGGSLLILLLIFVWAMNR